MVLSRVGADPSAGKACRRPAGGETRPLSSPFHAPRAEPASSRAILWQLAAGSRRPRHASAAMASARGQLNPPAILAVGRAFPPVGPKYPRVISI